MIICRSETASERLLRAQRTIKTMAVMLVVLLIAATIGTYSRNNTIEAQDAYIQALEARTSDLSAQVATLQGEIDAMQLQAVTQPVSRGSDRTAVVTAYTHTGNRTASGTWPEEGRTVAGPRNIPFGTVVWIEGIGERVVEDRTHERFDGRYDVFMDNESDCLEWGKQTVEVQVK